MALSFSKLHGCQPSRIRRDSPAFSSDVPRNETDVQHFFKMVLLLFSLPIILHFCLGKQQSDELPIKVGPYFARQQTPSVPYFMHSSRHQCLFVYAAGSITTAAVYHVPWVVDSDWIIASVLRIICAHYFPYSRDSVEKMVPKRKCKFNEDWRRGRWGGGGVEVCNIGESRPLTLAFVIIPISNAASERAFSMVMKIETDFRSELAQDTVRVHC